MFGFAAISLSVLIVKGLAEQTTKLRMALNAGNAQG